MNKEELQNFLQEQIPITKAMAFNVEEFTKSKVAISAKLKPNINDKGTVFGGSINALMTICGWALTFKNIQEVDKNAQVVIKQSNIKYFLPVEDDFTAQCELIDEECRNNFIENYKKHKKGRLKLKITIFNKDKLLVQYEGEYVALK